MLKKISVLILTVLLISCRSPLISTRSGLAEGTLDIDEATFNNSSFRVGVLIPLSGNDSRYGQGLKNAALMALEDMDNPNLILQFYDTESSPEGARVAAENALNQKVRMIIGPLTSSSVQAISYQTTGRNVPVIAFSTNTDVLQHQIYTLGLLVEEQVERIVGYASANGRRRFAVLVPDNQTGIATAKAAVAAATKNGGKVVKIAFYDPASSDFSEVIRQMTDYDRRSADISKEKQKLKAQAAKGDAAAQKALRRISAKDTSYGVDFDAVIIPESGAKLKSIAAMFGYYDVFAPDVKFLGTSVWENTKLNKESTLAGSWYPALSRNHNAYFNKKYQSLYGEYPHSLYAFAYDAVALSSALAKQNPYDINSAITNRDGFVGISGVFRIFANGKNQHSLDILEISSSGDIVVDLAPKKFSYLPDFDYNLTVAESYDEEPPAIFGKDRSSAETAVFGRRLGAQFQNGGIKDYWDGSENGHFRSFNHFYRR